MDVGYRIKVYSDIRYNVVLRSLQSDIGSSDIKLSPISLITDIGLSAHLCFSIGNNRKKINVKEESVPMWGWGMGIVGNNGW
jgi:hypothetical protein